ncbi:hypothetical protein CMK14_00145 [Candidatus Poribacteria bacterium]|nr:hypothetical protein [Candidatus Poribacteria bacterium]
MESLLQGLVFSQERVFFNSPFSVSLASSQLGATIRYTTDYSEPTATHSQVYRHPIRINQITVLRAAVFADASLPFNVVTKTIFLEIQQPSIPCLYSLWSLTTVISGATAALWKGIHLILPSVV